MNDLSKEAQEVDQAHGLNDAINSQANRPHSPTIPPEDRDPVDNVEGDKTTKPRDSTQPKYTQRPLVSDGYSGDSVTHAHTTMHSERQSGGSLYSYISTRDISQYIRELHGRTWNNLNDSYFLPSDESEWGRLDKQHSAFLIGFGGLYPCPEVVEPLLIPQDNGEPRRILDVGCGTGSWAIEMAHRFPQALVHGIDVAPVPLDSSLYPPNLSFELDDINHGLTHYYNRFDFIQMRCVMVGITDIERTLEELEMCLKPGGVLVVIDGDFQFEEDRRGYIKLAKVEGDEDVSGVSEKGSFFRRMVWETVQAGIIAGSGMDVTSGVLDYGPWDDPLCDPASTVTGSLFLPIGPWAEGSNSDETQMLRYSGMLMRQVFLNIHRAFHSMMLRQGMDQETLNEWSEHTEEELKSITHRMWVRFRFFWTRRREAEELPAPPLPTLQSSNAATVVTTGSESSHRHRYPAIEFYRTKEETLAKMAERKASIGILPQSAVEKAWLKRGDSVD